MNIMIRKAFILSCLLLCGMASSAQQTLNIHTTTQGIISFAFANKPEVTFPATDVLKVTSDAMTVEFPYSDIQKITFDDGETGVATITVRDHANQVRVYDLSGKLVLERAAKKGVVTVNLSTLPSGVYVVKDGKRTYKVRK